MRDYSILDNLGDGVQIIDQNMCYVYLNKKLLAEIQMEAKDVIGYSMVEKFPKIDQTEIYREIIRCLRTKESKSVLNEFTFEGRRQTFYEIKLHPVEEGVMLFTKDITDSKKGEIFLKETNKQLEHFVHIAAHDMREPVRRIEVLSEMLLIEFGGEIPDEAKVICEKLGKQASSLMRLISDFRKLSGIGGQDLQREEFSILDLAQKVSAQFEFEANGFCVKWPYSLMNVSAYPSLVAILLRNLYENALKHGLEEIEFSIKDEEDATGPIFSVSNKTKNKAIHKDIFLPFVTGGQKKSTGLGLAIAKKITDFHNGKIWSNQDGELFTISFTLSGNK